MAATGVTGVATTSDELANLEILQLDDEIYKTDRLNTPFASYLLNNKMSKHTTQGWVYHTFDMEHAPFAFKVGAAAASGDGTVNITDAATFLTLGDMLLHCVEGSMERCVVTATPSADASVSVERGVGGSTANAWTQGDMLVYLGNALEEDQSGSPDPRELKPVESTWGLQNMRMSCAVSKPQENTAHRYGSYRKLQQQYRMDRFKQGMELAGIFGAVNTSGNLYTGTNSSPVYSCKGLDQFITDNRKYMPEWTFAEFEDALERPFQFHKGEWAYLCSPLVFKKINRIARQYMQVNDKDERFGKRTYTLVTCWGDVELIVEPLMTFGACRGYGIVVPKPIEKFCRILLWDSDGLGSALHWQLDVLKDNAPTRTKDVLSGTFGYAFRQQGAFAVTHGTER